MAKTIISSSSSLEGEGTVNVKLGELLRVPVIVLVPLMIMVKMNMKIIFGLLMTAAMTRMMMLMAVDSL